MEYIHRLDLARMVKAKGPLPAAQAANYVHQAALGLQHAHERGMVHRDIKPSNLMLSHRDDKAVVKVCRVARRGSAWPHRRRLSHDARRKCLRRSARLPLGLPRRHQAQGRLPGLEPGVSGGAECAEAGNVTSSRSAMARHVPQKVLQALGGGWRLSWRVRYGPTFRSRSASSSRTAATRSG